MLNIASPSELVKTVGFAHTAATVARTPVVIGGLLMIPVNSCDANEHNAFAYETEVDNADAATGQAWAVNDPVYFDAANKRLTTASAGNTFFGYALQPKAADADKSPLVAFNSYFTAPA